MILVIVLVVLLFLQIFIGFRVRKQKMFVLGLAVTVVMTLLLLLFALSMVLSPDDPTVDRINQEAREGHKDAVQNVQDLDKKVVAIDKYVDCVAQSQDQAELDVCKAKKDLEVPPEKSIDPAKPEMGPEPTKQFTIWTDCEKPVSETDKTICTNTELKALNTELAKFDKKRLASRSKTDLYAWWKDLQRCGDEVACIKKQLTDEIYRAKH